MQKSQELLEAFSRVVMEAGIEWFYYNIYKKRENYRHTLKHVMDAYAKYLCREHNIKVVFVDRDGQVEYYIQDCSLEALTMLKLTIGANGT